MRQNRKRKTLHSALKANKLESGGSVKRVVLGLLCFALVAGLILGCVFVYGKLNELWIRQCEIKDVSKQVEITTGPNIKAGVLLEGFGLRKGANLAQIDFGERRRELLEKIPNLRSITVSRHLPDRVVIVAEEREPIARLAVKGNRNTGRVVDTEGVVFRRQTGTQILPTITEKNMTDVGKTLSPRGQAALRLIELCRDGEFATFNILDVNLSPSDFLYVTLGNYSFAEIAWPDMDEPIASTRSAMIRQMKQFRNAFNSGTTGPGTVWNVTMKDRAFADTKEPIL